MYHKEKIARLRAVPNTISGELMNFLVQDMVTLIRELSPKGRLCLKELHGPKGPYFPAKVNIEKDPDQDKNIQAADDICVSKDGKKILIETRDGDTDTDIMRQEELLDLYDELNQLNEDNDDPEFGYCITDNGAVAEKPLVTAS